MVHDKPVDIQQVGDYGKRPGETLHHGAIILVEENIRMYKYRKDSIVLAVVPDVPYPFWIWHRIVTSDSPTATGKFQVVETTAWGESFSQLDEATVAYNKRLNEYRERLHDLGGL